MLIGISGRKGSGKDTAATIIRSAFPTYNFRIDKFAAPMKEFIAKLLGVNIEALELQEFKERPLGEEWKVFVETSSYNYDYRKIRKEASGFVHEEEYYNTPRWMLQSLGTEWGRNTIHPDIWINALFNKYNRNPKVHFVLAYTAKHGKGLKRAKEYVDSRTDEQLLEEFGSIIPNLIISDVRFDNEAQAIKDKGGFIIEIERDVDSTDSHASEKRLSDSMIDFVVINDGTLEEFENLLIMVVNAKLDRT